MKFDVDFQNLNYPADVIAKIILTKINPERDWGFFKEDFYIHLTEVPLDVKNDVDHRVDSFFVEHLITPNDEIIKYVAIVDSKPVLIYITPNEAVLFRNDEEDWNICWSDDENKWMFSDLTDLIV